MLLPAISACFAAYFGMVWDSETARWVAITLGAVTVLLAGVFFWQARRGAAGFWLHQGNGFSLLPLGVAGLVLLSASATTQWQQTPVAEAVSDGRYLSVEIELNEDFAKAPERFKQRRVAAKIQAVTLKSGHQWQVSFPITLQVASKNSWPGYEVGDTLAVSGTFRENDYSITFRAEGSAIMTQRAWLLQQIATAINREFTQQVSTLLADWPDAAALVPGMVLGDRSAQSQELGTAMKTTGLSHLTAVSGSNCAMVIAAVVLLLRSFRAPRWLVTVASLAAVAGFVILVKPDPSILRAALMSGLGLLSILSGRRHRAGPALCWVVVVMLLLDPSLVEDFAFILSVAATAGILLFAGNIQQSLSRWMPESLALFFAVPVAAQLACAPVLVLLQPQFSSYAVLANALAAPAVAPTTIFGLAAALLSSTLPWLATPLILLSGACAAWIGFLAQTIATWPGAALPWLEGTQGVISMAIVSILGIAMICLPVLYEFFPRTITGLYRVLISWLRILTPALSFSLGVLIGVPLSRQFFGLPA